MSSPNKIYGRIGGNSIVGGQSKVRITHEGLMSNIVGSEFNAYQENAFHMAAEMDPVTPDEFVGESDQGHTRFKPKNPEELITESTGVHSIFNKLHAVPVEAKTYAWRVSQNMPLIDSPKHRQLQRSMNSCTVRDLVQKSQAGLLGTAVYSYSDFMFCKYLGRVPNNYLITLRRYPIPVVDYIKPYGNPNAINGQDKESTQTDIGGVPLATMVTWMGTPGNDMKEILKYEFAMPFKQINSKFEPDGYEAPEAVGKESQGQIGNAFKLAFGDAVYQRAANHIMPGIFNRQGGKTIPARTPHYDENKAYAGVDMIKSIYIRDGEKGLQFKHSFKLTFDYELRSYDGVNGKQAMLDLLGNILTCCYTTGDFWPGAYRRNTAASSIAPLSSLECMKHHNTFSGYVNAFQKDFQTVKGKISAKFSENPIKALTNMLDDLGGALLGGDMNLASPQTKQTVNALLSDTAVGFWHVTVGNPCAPIMSIGNLIMTGCQVEHYGPLGIDDFPTGLRVTCMFDSGKPRDNRLIERMYNGGNDRIYMPLDAEVLKMLRDAGDFNQNIAKTMGHDPGKRGTAAVDLNKTIATRRQEASSAASNIVNPNSFTSINTQVSCVDRLNTADQVKKYFGAMAGDLQYAVNIAAGSVGEGVIAPTRQQEVKQ